MPRKTKSSATKSEESKTTIRSVKSKELESCNKTKKELSSWGLYRNPTPTKRIKSVDMLQEAVDTFFDSCNGGVPPTVSKLALYLGYPSAASVYREIANPVEPEYSHVLEAAVDHIDDMLTTMQLQMAVASEDYRGFDAALKRMDLARDKAEGNSANGNGLRVGGSVNIQINMEKKEKLASLIDDSIADVMKIVDISEEA